MINSLVVPKRFSEGFEIDTDWIDDFEEETKLIQDVCDDLYETNTRKLVMLLEAYFDDEYRSLKMAINQPAVYCLLDGYIKQKLFEKADQLYLEVFDQPQVDQKALCLNLLVGYKMTGHTAKIATFSDSVYSNHDRSIQGHYLTSLFSLVNDDTPSFIEKLIRMARIFGISEETKSIYLDFKDICKRKNVLIEVRMALRQARDTEKTESLRLLYDLM